MNETADLGIFIATTKGSVGIQRITEEDPEIASVVCLAGKAMPLPISNAYQDFVRQATGVVQRDFGHGSFRVDLSATIEDGYSWQLGLYLGHAAETADRLTGDPAHEAIHVFATGEVNVDLEVLSVDHVTLKLERLKNHVGNLSAEGTRVIIIVPSGNLEEAPDDFAHGNIELHGVSTVAEALRAIGITAEPRPKKSTNVILTPPAIPEKKINRAKGLVLALIGLIMIGIAAAYITYETSFEAWASLERAGKYRALDNALKKANDSGVIDRFRANIYQNYLIATRPDKDRLRIRLIEHRAPEGKTCAAFHLGRVKAIVTESQRRSERAFQVGQITGLCQLEFIAEADANSIYLWGRYVRWPSDGQKFSEIITRGPSRQRLRWKIDLTRQLQRDYIIHIAVVADDQPVDGASGWVAEQLWTGDPSNILARWEQRLRSLNARGFELVDATFSLTR